MVRGSPARGVRQLPTQDTRWTTLSNANAVPNRSRSIDAGNCSARRLELSDEQVETIRLHAHAMAHVLIEVFLRRRTAEVEPMARRTIDLPAPTTGLSCDPWPAPSSTSASAPRSRLKT